MRSVAILCFFLSGASGLIFQVIWTRMFSLVFGATTLALSTVLTAFMGGLALGSFIAGRLADRIKDPLKAYALAEAGVGLFALILPLVVARFGGLNAWLYQHFADNYFMLAGGRFLASAALIIVPTTLMGATLPLLSRFFVQTRAEHARVGLRVGTLYAVNTFGAVLGTAIGGFVLLPELGLSRTNSIAALTNIALASVVGIAYWLRKRRPPPPAVDDETAEMLDEIGTVPPVHVQVSARARRWALVGIGISGAAAMTLQVILSRTLNMTIGSSVYSFTIVLSAYLIGLAGGAALIGRLTASSKRPVLLLAINHLCIALLVGCAYLLTDKLGSVFLSFIGSEQLDATRIMWSQFGVTVLSLLPVTFAMGGIFPLTMRIYSASLDGVGKDVGTAYSVNTIGAIFGSFVAGFVVIPVLQLQPGIFFVALCSFTLAAALAWLSRASTQVRIGIVCACFVCVLCWGLLPRWDLHRVSAGLFRPSVARDVIKQGGKIERPKLVFYRDGISTTVSVEQWSKPHFSLKNNGKVDASTGDDMPTQILVGLLPILMHPKAPEFHPEVALIGFASGVSAGAILQYPVKRLDVVELEPAILSASRFFNHVNHKPLQDKHARVMADDGRNFLAATANRYDVIVNEPSNPWITGVSNLFTREYFEIGKRKLKPGGIFCTWAQLYEIAPRRIKSIYRAFVSTFRYTYAFSAATLSSDTFLIGSDRPLALDIRRLRRAWNNRRLAKELDRSKVESPNDLAALMLMTPREMRAFIVGARVNTDDNALVEFNAPRDLYNHQKYDYYVSRIYGQTWLYGRIESALAGYHSSEDWAGLVRSLLTHGKFREAKRFFEHVEAKKGPKSQLVAHLMDLLSARAVIDPEITLTAGGKPLAPPKVAAKHGAKMQERVAREYYVVEVLAKKGDYAGALKLIEAWPEAVREKGGHDFQLLWGVIAYKNSNYYNARNILSPLLEVDGFEKRRPALLYYLGRAYYGNADYAESIKQLEAWVHHRMAVKKPVAPRPAKKSDADLDDDSDDGDLE
ncbi:MAG: fused MFS/spermidine synthase [Myxococcales bacterium]|nr:fused MFS/spermidine synthase [Myxococcales bacterium]